MPKCLQDLGQSIHGLCSSAPLMVMEVYGALHPDVTKIYVAPLLCTISKKVNTETLMQLYQKDVLFLKIYVGILAIHLPPYNVYGFNVYGEYSRLQILKGSSYCQNCQFYNDSFIFTMTVSLRIYIFQLPINKCTIKKAKHQRMRICWDFATLDCTVSVH